MLELIDVSSHNPTMDWQAAAAGGIAGAIVKGTEGIGYVNPLMAAQLAGARAQLAIVGHYGYARQDQDPTPEGEADYYLAHSDIRDGELVAIDCEWAGGPPPDYSAWVLGYLGRLEAQLQRTPDQLVIYTYWDWARQHLTDPRLARYRLWFASYQSQAPTAPPPWADWDLWQYAGDATGVPGCGEPTDRTRYPGTLDALRALAAPVDDCHARLMAYWAALPLWLQGSADPRVWYEAGAEFGAAGIAGAGIPAEGHCLCGEYLTVWTAPGDAEIHPLQRSTEAQLRAAGRLVKWGG